jgi:hypothetical protein
MHISMLSMASMIPFLVLLTLQPPIHPSNTHAHNTHRNRRLKLPLSLPKHPFPHVRGLFHPIAESLDKLRKSKLKVTRTKKKPNFTKQLQNYIKSIAGHVNGKGFPPKQRGQNSEYGSKNPQNQKYKGKTKPHPDNQQIIITNSVEDEDKGTDKKFVQLMEVMHKTIHQIMQLKKADSEEIKMKGIHHTFSEDPLRHDQVSVPTLYPTPLSSSYHMCI